MKNNRKNIFINTTLIFILILGFVLIKTTNIDDKILTQIKIYTYSKRVKEIAIEKACRNNDFEKINHLLGEFHGADLQLNGLTDISPEAAKVVSIFPYGEHYWEDSSFWENYKGEKRSYNDLHFDGLKTISQEVAKSLSKYVGYYLYLNGLSTISPEVAKELSNINSIGLYLDGISYISPDAARELVKYHGRRLSLNGLSTISPEVAKELSNSTVYYLHLEGLTNIDLETAIELNKFRGIELHLDGLKAISPEIAKALEKWIDR